MLELVGLNAGYGAIQIVWDVSLTVRPGEVVALVGRNGAGKSTTLKAIVGLAQVFSGSIRVGGRSLVGRPTALMASYGIGYVPQERELCANLSVEENLLVPIYARRLPRKRLGAIYERFSRLKERRNQKAGSLSGGERKLLAFARILLLDPAVLLVDEPVEGLMPAVVAEVGGLIRQLCAGGTGVLLVEQDVGLIRRTADRAYLMSRGRIEASVREIGQRELAQFLGI
ncbi:MAG: ABC transporter ATP-binding protein [Deltaproteobacteria bacterium]|jgi:branched-chain amino acid transport system ATP-binding protein|nr:ABC transporter ATP-binding protein [Deltaproteobacteria bacterium]